MSEISTYLKVGTAAWVLRVIEAGLLGPSCGWTRRWPRCERSATTSACTTTIGLVDGRTITAVGLQEVYLDACRPHTTRWPAT